MDAAEDPPQQDEAGALRGGAALAGGVATGVALGVSELLAGVIPNAASAVIAVGDAVVDRVPVPVKNAAISLFGTADKVVLLIGVVVVCAAVGAAIGIAARRRFAVGAAAFVAFGVVGVLAATGDPRASVPATALALVVGVAVGLLMLRRLLASRVAAQGGSGMARRRFLRLAGTGIVAAAAAAWTGRSLRTRTVATASRAELQVPPPTATASPLSAAADLEVPNLPPFVTPNHSFYRIDTALSVPRIDVETWRLRVTGLVDRPVEWSFDELVELGLEEHWTTLCCVSNEVGGNLIGNALWSGVPLEKVLTEAGVQLEATQIVGRSVDGWTAGFPTAAAFDGRAAMVAVAMNGEPLPVEHGFPARLVVPGLYGYVSATKWLAEIEMTTWEDFDAYWVPRGWSKRGPIKTQSRIDVPRPGSISRGPQAVAGVAWAQGRGIERVEVQFDDGPWVQARLGAVPNDDTWRQWVIEWDATPGSHVLQVRSTDANGDTQVEQRQGVMPDGATGYHRVLVQVI